MARTSAGLLMYRQRAAGIEVLLGHPGGPFFSRRDDGCWSLPKGYVEDGESPFAGARREFAEETGLGTATLPTDEAATIDLGEASLAGGKRVRAWAFEGDCDPDALASNTFEVEWPPSSGRRQSFPEIDRFGFFDLAAAATKLGSGQQPFLERLERAYASANSRQ